MCADRGVNATSQLQPNELLHQLLSCVCTQDHQAVSAPGLLVTAVSGGAWQGDGGAPGEGWALPEHAMCTESGVGGAAQLSPNELLNQLLGYCSSGAGGSGCAQTPNAGRAQVVSPVGGSGLVGSRGGSTPQHGGATGTPQHGGATPQRGGTSGGGAGGPAGGTPRSLPSGGGALAALAGAGGPPGASGSEVSTLSGCSAPGGSAPRGHLQGAMLRCAGPVLFKSIFQSFSVMFTSIRKSLTVVLR